MEKSILGIPQQFTYSPEIINSDRLTNHQKFIVLGMGGSHLAAGIIKSVDPQTPILIHWDYSLPDLSDAELQNCLIIACSYSGNTEEVIDGLREAMAKSLPVSVISTGGQLLDLAVSHNLPYIKLPDSDTQPRLALGFFLKALALLMNRADILSNTNDLTNLNPALLKSTGENIAQELVGRVPVIYSSRSNSALAYNWKIKLNETSKTPAFYNIIPEMNHNEMTGFDQITDGQLSAKFSFIFITDSKDDPRIINRFEVLTKLYQDRNLPVHQIKLAGQNRLEQIFNNLILADWVSLSLANIYGHEPEQVPMVEEFKSLISHNI